MTRIWLLVALPGYEDYSKQQFGADTLIFDAPPVRESVTFAGYGILEAFRIEPLHQKNAFVNVALHVPARAFWLKETEMEMQQETVIQPVQPDAEITPEKPIQKARPEKKSGYAKRQRTPDKRGQKPGQAVRVFLMADVDNWKLSVRDIARELNVSKSVVSSVRAQLLNEKGQVQ